MARPRKQGLDYFTCDVNFYQDIKIRKLIRHKGIQAVSVYHILLCQIYSVGYYIEWDADLPFVISEVSDLQEDYVSDVIRYALSIGLFDQVIYDEYHVLTSRGIQERFFDFCTVAKRKIANDTPYLLVDMKGKTVSSANKTVTTEENHVSSEDNTVNTEETPVSNVKSTQSKGKERNTDGSLHSPSSSSDTTASHADTINIQAFQEFFNRTMQNHHAQIPTITQISGKRRQALLARLRQYGKEALRKAVVNAATSAFLNGGGSKVFVASFDWIMRPNNFPKVLEGNYQFDIKETDHVSKKGTTQQPTAQQRIDAEVKRGARHVSELLAKNETSLRDGVPQKVW